jgi:hypothetical protein
MEVTNDQFPVTNGQALRAFGESAPPRITGHWSLVTGHFL